MCPSNGSAVLGLRAGTLGLVLVLFAGCSDGDSSPGPTAPAASLTLSQASVQVGGQEVGGETVAHSRLQGESTLFACYLGEPAGPVTGQDVWVDLDGPHAMGRMHDRFRLHDDGLGCDPVAGDGYYCLEDHEGQYGIHHAGARHGEYHYEFYGYHHDGRESNHVQVMVNLTN